jgi:concanavalin A-like lectin/glucanase superfamily protein
VLCRNFFSHQRGDVQGYGRFLALTLLVYCMYLALTPAAGAAARNSQLRSDKDFRVAFGLRSDDAHIRDLRRRQTGTVMAYGIRMTRDEEQALSSRFAQLDELKRAIQRYVSQMPASEFGGMFIDQQAGGLLYLEVTTGAKRHADRLAAIVPYAHRLRVATVQTTAGELDVTHSRVVHDIRRLRRKGIRISSVATIYRDNVVEIGVKPKTRAAVALLKRRYGASHVDVVPALPAGSQSRLDEPPPWRGGYALRDTPTSGDTCTMGFSAYRYEGTVVHYYQLTAGHCAPAGIPEGAGKYHSSTFVGTIIENSLAITATPPPRTPYAYASSDSASIAITSSNRSNRIYHETDPSARVTQVQALDSDVEGEFVCQSGKESLVQCGYITSRDYSRESEYNPNVYLLHLRRANYARDEGDSGAPVFGPVSGGTYEAKGIHHGFSGPEALYSHIGYVLSELGLDGVYTTQAHDVLRDGPVAYYRLGQRNKAATSASYSLPGTYKDVGYSASGPLPADPSAVFRGGTNDSSAQVGAFGALDLPASFTLEAWINPTAYVSGAGNGIIYKGTSGGAPAHYLYGGNYNLTLQYNGTVRFAFQYQDPADPAALNSYTVETPATAEGKAALGAWTHVVAVYDASGANCANKMAIYLNGVQRACGPTVGPAQYGPWTNANPLYIGRRAESASNANALVDEAAIYSYALSPLTISDHYGARTTAAAYKAGVLLAAPVAYYELNDAPRLKNETANAAEGTYLAYDSSTLGQPGVWDALDGDPAAAFSGNARGEVDGNNAYVNQSGDFTIEAWAKPAAVTSGTRTIVSKGATGANGGNYWLLTNGNDFSFWYQTQLASCSSNCTATNHTISWPTSKSAVVGQWYHVVGVFDKCDFPATECYARLYVDGVLEGTKSTKDGSGNFLAPKTNSYAFRIGLGGANSTVYSFGGGTIDDVAVYSKVLTDTQIQNHSSGRP